MEGPANFGMPEPLENEYKEVAWGMPKQGEKFAPMWINRHNIAVKDVKFDVLYCGICHSDCLLGQNPIGTTSFPFVPGHEFIGRVTEVGSEVTKFKAGDLVGVGCYVDSCNECASCEEGEENYCEKGNVLSINAEKKYKRVGGNPATRTQGGYSGSHVVNEHFAIKFPENVDLERAAPIMCGGITMFDPLKHWGYLNSEKKKTVGVVGIGGLGTFGIKLAAAMGHTVVAVSTTAKKEQMAKDKGAHHFVVSTDPESIKSMAGKVDLILNTVSADHDLNVYLPLLAKNGTIVQIGVALKPHPIMQFVLMRGRKSISGSGVGGVGNGNHQECVDFCIKHNIYPECETIQANKIDWAWDKLCGPGGNADGVRYVIDIKKSLADDTFLPK